MEQTPARPARSRTGNTRPEYSRAENKRTGGADRPSGPATGDAPSPAPIQRMIDPEYRGEDRADELSLRPRTLSEYIGQERMKANLSVFIQAALARHEPLDHVMVYGPPGLGKTTIAYIVAQEMGTSIRCTSGPALERAGDLAAILTGLEGVGILFIDEIHRLHPVLEEILYQAMEEFRIDVVIGQGPGARTVKIELPRFTLIGATTRFGLITAPLRDRFGIVHHLDFYPVEDLVRIVARSAGILGAQVDAGGAAAIGRRARGTPRIANRLLRRVRDFAQVGGDGGIGGEVADRYLERLEVDRYGLDRLDRRILLTIYEKFDNGPVGVNTIAAALGEEPETLEEIYEPYLLQIGFLDRTPRGRRITSRAIEHLGIAGRPRPQGALWT